MSGPERPTDTSRPIIAKEDVEAAQAVIDAWTEARVTSDTTEALNAGGGLAYLRGLITQALADAHARGFEHGLDRGRRQIGNRLRVLLEDEAI